MDVQIDELIEDITVDAYGAYEQLSSFVQAFEDTARFPFDCRVIGVEAEVIEVVFEGDDRRGLIAVCRRAGERHTVSLLDVYPAGPLSVETSNLIEAYRRWSGAEPIALTSPALGRWVYQPSGLVDLDFDVGPPLELIPTGDWDPGREDWREEGAPIPALWRQVIAAGVRPSFEMEQVLPGIDPDDWDTDPIVEAADLHRVGRDRDSIAILDELLALDRRCVDAWAHLGLIAFDTSGPGAALEFYRSGVGIAELALPDGFDGVLPRGLIDNRPFLRCLHGLALCAWRQRRWDDAESIFTGLVWLDPTGSMNALACLESVRAHHRWQRT